MLEHYQINTSGMKAVVVGRSNIVGSPMSILLARNSNPGNCIVTLTHSRTQNLQEEVLQGDIVVAAIGRKNFVTAEMVKEGAIVIDVGINRENSAETKFLPKMPVHSTLLVTEKSAIKVLSIVELRQQIFKLINANQFAYLLQSSKLLNIFFGNIPQNGGGSRYELR